MSTECGAKEEWERRAHNLFQEHSTQKTTQIFVETTQTTHQVDVLSVLTGQLITEYEHEFGRQALTYLCGCLREIARNGPNCETRMSKVDPEKRTKTPNKCLQELRDPDTQISKESPFYADPDREYAQAIFGIYDALIKEKRRRKAFP